MGCVAVALVVAAAIPSARASPVSPAIVADVPAPPAPDRRPASNTFQLNFQVDAESGRALADRHRRMCEEARDQACRVIKFDPGLNDGQEYMTAEMELAPGSGPEFLEMLARSSRSAGFDLTQSQARMNPREDPAELRLDQRLLSRQIEELLELENSTPADARDALKRRTERLSRELDRVTERLGRASATPAADLIRVSYHDPSQSGRSFWRTDTGEFVLMSGLALLAVTGVALLTVIYFGILAFGFLRFRKFARKRGLIKGGPEQ